MPRGTPWDSLTCELRACAGLLPLFKGDWKYCWCSEVYCSDASKKKMVVCVAHGTCLSRRASWLSFGTHSLPQSGGSEGAREHAFQQLGLADTATEDEYSEMEYEEVQDFPDICAEMLSADAGRFVQKQCSVRVKDTRTCAYFSFSATWHRLLLLPKVFLCLPSFVAYMESHTVQNCHLVFRGVPSEFSCSDRESRFYDAADDPPRVCPVA